MDMDRRIWHVGTAVLILVTILSVRLVYWQLIRGEELQPVVLNPIFDSETSGELSLEGLNSEALESFDTLPLPVQQRTNEVLASIVRGNILDRNGRVLAFDVEDETGFRSRGYHNMGMAPILGYTSGLRVGLTGIEQYFNESLFGIDRADGQVSLLLHQPIVGSNVYLTVDTELQNATAGVLGGRRGSIVVMDAKSGEILAMVSNPTFDPNQILDPAYADGLINCDNPGCQGALINRATQGLYVPGSIWKTVTLIAALDSGHVTPDTVFDFGQQRSGPDGRYYVYEVDGAEFKDPNPASIWFALSLSRPMPLSPGWATRCRRNSLSVTPRRWASVRKRTLFRWRFKPPRANWPMTLRNLEPTMSSRLRPVSARVKS